MTNRKSEERKSDLRNTTVMEVILAVIIIMIFVVFQKHEKNESLEDSIGEMENAISLNKEIIKKRDKTIKKLREKITKISKELKDNKRKLDEAEQNLKMYKNEWEQLKKKLVDNCYGDLECERGIPKKPITIEIPPEPEPEPELELEPIISESLGGLDKPNCIADIVKDKPIADIYLHDKSSENEEDWQYKFEFHNGISEDQQDYFKINVPGIETMAEKEILSQREFESAGNKILRWSDEQTPQCRFFAVIHKSGLKRRDKDYIYFKDVVSDFFFRSRDKIH